MIRHALVMIGMKYKLVLLTSYAIGCMSMVFLGNAIGIDPRLNYFLAVIGFLWVSLIWVKAELKREIEQSQDKLEKN